MPISVRAARALATFGIVPDPAALAARHAARLTRARDIAGALRTRLAPGQIALITGPSGSGKSTILRQLRAALEGSTCIITPTTSRHTGMLIDALPGPLDRALGTLASAGLADAELFARPAAHLSDGERARLVLAQALHRAACKARRGQHAWILLDEFTAPLDRHTALGVAAALSRHIRRSTTRLVVATAHDDVASSLRPDILIHQPANAPATITAPPAAPSLFDAIPIELGSIHDYDALARFHYRAGRPATHVRTLVIRGAPLGLDTPLAVLVVSMPTLNGSWRGAFSTELSSLSRRDAAAWINANLRTISRVVVEPRFRGLGLARRLVEHYLRSPLTPGTEAIATMGHFCPFFEHAGMTPHAVPLPAPDARLLDALDHAHMPVSRLTSFLARTRAESQRAFLERELAHWARSSRRTSRHATRPAPELATLAAVHLAARPIAYTHMKDRA